MWGEAEDWRRMGAGVFWVSLGFVMGGELMPGDSTSRSILVGYMKLTSDLCCWCRVSSSSGCGLRRTCMKLPLLSCDFPASCPLTFSSPMGVSLYVMSFFTVRQGKI